MRCVRAKKGSVFFLGFLFNLTMTTVVCGRALTLGLQAIPDPVARVAFSKVSRADRPWVQVVAAHLEVAGSGGTLSPNLSLSSQHTEQGTQIGIRTSSLLPRTYYVWITEKGEETMLLPIKASP